MGGDLGSGDNANDPRHLLRIGRIDRNDAGMRMWAAQEGDMHHAGQADVVAIAPAAVQEP